MSLPRLGYKATVAPILGSLAPTAHSEGSQVPCYKAAPRRGQYSGELEGASSQQPAKAWDLTPSAPTESYVSSWRRSWALDPHPPSVKPSDETTALGNCLTDVLLETLRQRHLGPWLREIMR